MTLYSSWSAILILTTILLEMDSFILAEAVNE